MVFAAQPQALSQQGNLVREVEAVSKRHFCMKFGHVVKLSTQEGNSQAKTSAIIEEDVDRLRVLHAFALQVRGKLS